MQEHHGLRLRLGRTGGVRRHSRELTGAGKPLVPIAVVLPLFIVLAGSRLVVGEEPGRSLADRYCASRDRAAAWGEYSQEEQALLELLTKSDDVPFWTEMAYGDFQLRHYLFLAVAHDGDVPHDVPSQEMAFRKAAAWGSLSRGLALARSLQAGMDKPEASDRLKAELLRTGALSFSAVRQHELVQPLWRSAQRFLGAEKLSVREAAYAAVGLLSPIGPASERRIRELFSAEEDIYLRERLARYAMMGGFRFGLIECARIVAAVHAEQPQGVVEDAPSFAAAFLKGLGPHETRDWPTLLRVLEESSEKFHFEGGLSPKWVRRRAEPQP